MTQSPKAFALPKSLSVSALERALYPNLAPKTKAQIVFDLSDCSWIEPPSLLYLLALYMMRHTSGLQTRLMLPRHRAALHFLEAWRFPEAFESATGQRLSSVSDGEHRSYFDSGQHDDNPYLGRLIETPYGADRLLSKYFFEINSFKRQHDLFEPSFALSEASKWHRVARVLKDVLSGPSNLLASRIVYEALANAIRHPGANTIQLVSQLKKQGDKGGQFVISVWDDGKAIADVLQRVVISGHNIRPASDIGLTATYVSQIEEGFSSRQSSSVVTSDQVPNAFGKEEDFLLASVFPGTTSDYGGHTAHPSELDDPRDLILTQPGMGLYLLVNTAVSVYGGEVLLRSGHWRLRLQRADNADGAIGSPDAKGQPESYTASLRHYKAWPNFHGNLITVRLPLLEAKH